MSSASSVRRRRAPSSGFTLIELLLSLFLLGLLFGALVFTFTSLSQSAALDEGADRLESLIRLAQAQASAAGRRIQIQFEPAPDSAAARPLYRLRLRWEPDPLGQPGVFQDLREPAVNLDDLHTLIGVEDVILSTGPVPASAGISPEVAPGPAESADTSEPPGTEGSPLAGSAEPAGLPPLTFHPDGSQEGARVLIVPRESEDGRRMWIRIAPVTGVLSRQVLQPPAAAEGSAPVESEAGSAAGGAAGAAPVGGP